MNMHKIVLCKYCGKPEYYGKMKWLNGITECRSCYKADYEESHRKIYFWDDLDGPRPTMDEYNAQKGERMTVDASTNGK